MSPRARPSAGARAVSTQARRVASRLRPGVELRSGFTGLTGALHLEWVDGLSRLIPPDQDPI